MYRTLIIFVDQQSHKKGLKQLKWERERVAIQRTDLWIQCVDKIIGFEKDEPVIIDPDKSGFYCLVGITDAGEAKELCDILITANIKFTHKFI
jgi:hypothetical protein